MVDENVDAMAASDRSDNEEDYLLIRKKMTDNPVMVPATEQSNTVPTSDILTDPHNDPHPSPDEGYVEEEEYVVTKIKMEPPSQEDDEGGQDTSFDVHDLSGEIEELNDLTDSLVSPYFLFIGFRQR